MGRYMRKAKSGEVAVEVNSSSGGQQSIVGVRTRARTLALQRHQDSSSSCYLELRSRRLEKAAFKESPNPSPRSKNGKSSSNPRLGEGEEIEASFGENVVDFDAAAR